MNTQNPKVQEFINCEFEYECPKDWFRLKPTNTSGIKHCTECDKDVHLCANKEELAIAIAQKHCIAYFQDPSLQSRFKLSREKCEANKADVNFVPNIFLGLPKGGSLPIPLSYNLNSDNSNNNEEK